MKAEVQHHGTLCTFLALDTETENWVRNNVSSDGFQPAYPELLYIDHGLAYDLVVGFQADGGEVA